MFVAVALFCWVVQGLAMLVDEFYFHHKRGLGKWESIGHPVDTFFFLLCFIFAWLVPHTDFHLEWILWTLSGISCLIITKDEWIHTQQSSAAENWLHALQFVIHPLSLVCLFLMWKFDAKFFIQIQAMIIFIFMIYQILYWNFIRKNKYAIKN